MATDMFLKLDGIKGESKVKDHIDEIDVESWSWGLNQSGTSHGGGGSGSGKVTVHDVTFTHFIDKSSTNLILFCANGKHIPGGLLTVRKAGEKPLDYYKMKLVDIIVTGVQYSGAQGGADRLTETVSLNFSKFEVLYQAQKADGSGEPGGEVKWDIKSGAKY